MSGTKLHSTIDWSDQTVKPSQHAAFVRPVQILETDMADPKMSAFHMRRVESQVTDATQVARSHPEQGSVTFKNVVCGTAGAKIQLAHNLGHNAQWIVTYWAGQGVGNPPNLVSDELDTAGVQTDANNLYLHSGVAGTATIRVF